MKPEGLQLSESENTASEARILTSGPARLPT